jgi:hypothetical protein
VAKNYTSLVSGFFKDTDGHVVIWQAPNIALSGWIIFKVVSLLVTKGRFKSGSEQLSTAFLFTWAYLETTKGVSSFRKVLGLIVIITLILGYFQK